MNYVKDDEIRSITGTLIAFEENKITVRQKDEEISILLLDIEEAKIKLKW